MEQLEEGPEALVVLLDGRVAVVATSKREARVLPVQVHTVQVVLVAQLHEVLNEALAPVGLGDRGREAGRAPVAPDAHEQLRAGRLGRRARLEHELRPRQPVVCAQPASRLDLEREEDELRDGAAHRGKVGALITPLGQVRGDREVSDRCGGGQARERDPEARHRHFLGRRRRK